MDESKHKAIPAPCIGANCSKASFARGMCKTHYSRWRLHGDCNITKTPGRLPTLCEVDGCSGRPHSRWKKGKAMCQAHWQCMYRYGTELPPADAPADPMPLCSIAGCKYECRSRSSGLCEKHYGRVRRGVGVDVERLPLHQYVTKAGYVVLVQPDHPLATRGGRAAQHRVIAYDTHDGVCPNCFWCGRALAWGDAVVDHLDEDKQNNDPLNLAVACNQCNRARGALLPFIASLTDAALPEFIKRLMSYRDKQREEAAQQRYE
jgi:hypothetical protein